MHCPPYHFFRNPIKSFFQIHKAKIELLGNWCEAEIILQEWITIEIIAKPERKEKLCTVKIIFDSVHGVLVFFLQSRYMCLTTICYNFVEFPKIWLCLSFVGINDVLSVLWHCWLGSRKGIRPVKNRVVGCWHGYLSGVRCRTTNIVSLDNFYFLC